MQLPSKIVYTAASPSDVICGRLLTGDESVLINLTVHLDVHIGPGVMPVKSYFEKSKFIDTLHKIFTTEGVDLSGKMGEIKSEIVAHDSIENMKTHIIESDYTDLIDISCNEIVPGIFTVCAKTDGETKVSCLRNLDKMILDCLFVEIVTDYFLLQCSGIDSEN